LKCKEVRLSSPRGLDEMQMEEPTLRKQPSEERQGHIAKTPTGLGKRFKNHLLKKSGFLANGQPQRQRWVPVGCLCQHREVLLSFTYWNAVVQLPINENNLQSLEDLAEKMEIEAVKEACGQYRAYLSLDNDVKTVMAEYVFFRGTKLRRPFFSPLYMPKSSAPWSGHMDFGCYQLNSSVL
jgi:hypothetical protein